MKCKSILSIFFLVALSQLFAVETNPDRIKYGYYEDSKNGFSIDIPKEWVVLPNQTASLVMAAPQDRSTTKFRPSLNIIVDRITHKATLNELFDINVKNAGAVLHQFRIVEITDVKVDDVPAQRMVYTCKIFRNGMYLDVKNIVYCLVKDNIFYIITCSALDEQYDKYYSLFMRLIGSVSIFYPTGKIGSSY
ncbi:MAG: hypothetical protein JHC93_08150 [Parachlamydiales bacterium]|nr:hypothetical protein [Parachlamydiales bacterium]